MNQEKEPKHSPFSTEWPEDDYEVPGDFHEAMERLRDVADRLDSGELPLEEAMQQYREGLRLIEFCEDRLEEAELLIEEVDDTDPSRPEIRPKDSPDS